MIAEIAQAAVANLAAALEARLGLETVQVRASLGRYTALRLGGPADLLVVAETTEALRQAVALGWAHDVPVRVLGGGSNVLISEAGLRGLVVYNQAKLITFTDVGVRVASGASLSTVARQSVNRGLAGLEWAVGIPGTVGGAVYGNAGAWGGDVASSLVQATVLEPPSTAVKWPVERFAYAYRSSALKRRAAGGQPAAIVLDAEFALQEGSAATLKKRVSEITTKRRASQPTGATCGSVFKNPAGDYAGRLIEAVGLKGKRHGGAEISMVHANFVVNRDQASAADAKGLIDLARQKVQEQFGIALELEIELLGEWPADGPPTPIGSGS